MGLVSLQANEDDEQEGEKVLELVAIRYTGDRSSLPTRGAINNQGQWPGTGVLNGRSDGPGPWYFGLVPDEGLAYLERRTDIELIYADDKESFAEALLSKNQLPSNVFGSRAGPARERVFDALGLKPTVEGGPLREQLANVANVEETPEPEEDTSREEALLEHSRTALKEACAELRDGPDDIELTGDKTEFASWLASQDDDEVNGALGGDD